MTQGGVASVVILCLALQAMLPSSSDAFQGPVAPRSSLHPSAQHQHHLLPSRSTITTTTRSSNTVVLQASTESSAYVPPPVDDEESANDNEDDEDVLEKVEQLGRGAAKTKRGKRKSGGAASKAPAVKVNLAPEEVFYEGPPAITETIVPTASILTVIGVIPAAAAWARQAWVRYKITTRRIRVTSGIGGKDMAEIVYPDIVEIRTAKRLFGDGDLVAFLRDGAKFEMRNIPNFDDTMEFILKQVSRDVAEQYRAKGDVTNAR